MILITVPENTRNGKDWPILFFGKILVAIIQHYTIRRHYDYLVASGKHLTVGAFFILQLIQKFKIEEIRI